MLADLTELEGGFEVEGSTANNRAGRRRTRSDSVRRSVAEEEVGDRGRRTPDYFLEDIRRIPAWSSLNAASSDAITVCSSCAGGIIFDWKSPTTFTAVFAPFGL